MAWFKKSVVVIIASVFLVAPVSAHADDDDDDDDRRRGHHYRKKLDRETDYTLYCQCPASSSRALEPFTSAAPALTRKPPARIPEGFPKETPDERASAKQRQVELLEKELMHEQELLAKATAAQAHDDVQLHRRNVAAIRRELGHLYR